MESIVPGQRCTTSGRALLPSEAKIRAYWAPLLAGAKGFDSPAEFLQPGICFACGWAGGLTRAHIRARVLGGSDGVENLHMLCSDCHEDSEGMEGQGYWVWFLFRSTADGAFSRATRMGVNPTAFIRVCEKRGQRAEVLQFAAASGLDFRDPRGRRG